MGIAATPAAPSEQDSLGTLISRLGTDIARLLRAEAGLLGMRLVAAVDVIQTLTVGMLAGIILSMTGFAFTMGAIVLVLARWLPPWAAALIVGGVLLALGVALATTAVRGGARDVTAALTTNPIETHPYD
jgi:membrane protein